MKTLLFILMLASAPAASLAASPDGNDVSGLLRILHSVQDEIARGDLSALSLQTELSGRLASALESPLSKAKNEADWAAVVIGYALDGASPQLARRLLATIDRQNPHYELARAVSDYTAGDMKAAAESFSRIDLNKVDPRLAPYAALAMGTALIETDRAGAISAFNKAVSHGPGTLVEEVALRRLAGLSVSAQDVSGFVRAANLYIRRYASSPFAGQFFAVLAEEMPRILSEEQSKAVMTLAAAQMPQTHIPVLLAMSEHNAMAGKLSLVRFAADNFLGKAKGMAGAGGQKYELYDVISGPAEKLDNTMLERVSRIDPALLSQNEQVLLAKTKSALQDILKPLSEVRGDKSETAGQLYKAAAKSGLQASIAQEPHDGPAGAGATAPERSATAPSQAADEVTQEADSILARAAVTLGEVDAILKAAEQ